MGQGAMPPDPYYPDIRYLKHSQAFFCQPPPQLYAIYLPIFVNLDLFKDKKGTIHAAKNAISLFWIYTNITLAYGITKRHSQY